MATEGGLIRSALLELSTQLTLKLTPPLSKRAANQGGRGGKSLGGNPSKGKENANKGGWEEEEEEKRERGMKTSREVTLKPAVFLPTTPSAGGLNGPGRIHYSTSSWGKEKKSWHTNMLQNEHVAPNAPMQSDLFGLHKDMLDIFSPHL